MVGMNVFVVLMITASVAYADDSEAHYEKGKQLYAEKDFAGAVAEFQAARAIDPQPRYVFNLAQAQRMAGRCGDAIASYEAFLATGPVEAQAGVARAGIEKCKPPPPPVTAPVPPTVPAQAPLFQQPVHRDVVERPRPRWYRDRWGDALVAAGAASAITSVSLYVLARRAASATFKTGTVDEYEANRERAGTRQTWAAVMAGVSALFVGGGVVRFVTVDREPGSGTIAVAAGGAF
jgi:tetratricopeptide (TPR) repeat protein